MQCKSNGFLQIKVIQLYICTHVQIENAPCVVCNQCTCDWETVLLLETPQNNKVDDYCRRGGGGGGGLLEGNFTVQPPHETSKMGFYDLGFGGSSQ